jgi:hypothetical protein
LALAESPLVGGRGSIRHVQLDKNPLNVGFDRANRALGTLGDFAVVKPLANKVENLDLSRAQT